MFKRFLKSHEYDKFFYPKSVAVVGASSETSKIGGYIFSQLLKHSNINSYPVNVKWEKVQGVKAYTNLSEIKQKVDLAIIVIPSRFVLDSVKDAIKAKIKNPN